MRRLTPLDKEILHIAIPAIVTNITVPLLGLVDLSIVGHMGDAAYIGSIAVGTMIFNVICWLFGFLRMGTSGLTSQAFGRHRPDEATVILKQSLGVGTAIGLIFVALQHWVKQLAFTAMAPTEAIALHASAYFDICIYSVPATLALYGLTGWYIGMQNTRIPMWVSMFQNVVNIAASLTFVYVLGMKVEGVALGTVVAQYAGRLHRENEGKKDVRIYDYIDIHEPVCESMYRKRLKGYSAIGYRVLSKDNPTLFDDTENLYTSSCEGQIFNGSTFRLAFMENLKSSKKNLKILAEF